MKIPGLTRRGRLPLLFVVRLLQNWQSILQIIRPDKLLRWHRQGFCLLWKFKSRRQKRSNSLGAVSGAARVEYCLLSLLTQCLGRVSKGLV